MKRLILTVLISSNIYAENLIGYGSSTATLTSKNQENIFMGFEYGLNEEIGERGSKIIMREQDNSGSQTASIGAAKKLYDNNVAGIFGFSGSHDSVLVGQYLAHKEILTILPGSNHNSLKDFGAAVFTTGHSMDTEVTTSIDFINHNFKRKKGIAIINPFALASASIDKILDSKDMQSRFSFNLQKVYLTKDMLLKEEDLKFFKTNKIDFLYITTYPEALVSTANQLEKNGIDIPLVAASSWGFGDTDLLRRFISNKKTSVFFSSEWSSNSRESRSFTNGFKKKYGREPTPENALGYDVGKIVGQSLKRIKGEVNRKSLLAAFRKNLCFSGLSVGRMCFPKSGGHSNVIPNFYRFSTNGNIRI